MTTPTPSSKKRRRRIAIWTLAAILSASVILPTGGYVAHLISSANAEALAEEGGFPGGENPRSQYWREVRESGEGYSAVTGAESGVLIQSRGQNWRQIRNRFVARYLPWLIVIVVGLLAAYHIFHGQNKLSERPKGKRILRWKFYERVLHWTTASLFIVMSITGLSLLLGRALLIPIFGKDGFSAFAEFAKFLHNYLGPPFAICVGLILILWMRHNIPNRHDWQWLRRWGGLLGGGNHPHAGRMNGGEKIWFWIIATAGVAVCASGLVLDFPNYEQSRSTMQTANIIHAALSICWIAVALGHIYIGTLGTEGALEGMTTGTVSEEWARQHHDLWLEEMQNQNAREDSASSAESSSASSFSSAEKGAS